MYKLSEKVVLQKLGPEVVVFRFSDERFFSLDSVASKMLEAIIEAGDPQRAASALLQYYDIDQATLEADVLAFVEKCEREGFWLVLNLPDEGWVRGLLVLAACVTVLWLMRLEPGSFVGRDVPERLHGARLSG